MGAYADTLADNVTFDDGDWNDDGVFDSADLVAAPKVGTYQPDDGVAAAVAAVKIANDRNTRSFRAMVTSGD